MIKNTIIKSKNNKISKYVSRFTLHLILIIGSFLMIVPFLWMIISSFKPNIDIISINFQLFSSNWTLENYQKIFREMPIFRAYLNSLFVAAVATFFTVLSSSAAGYLFAKLKFRARDALFFIVLGSIMIPAEIVIIPLYLMISRVNLVNSYTALIAPFLINAFGVFLMRQFIYGIPNENIEAARIDGASDWRIYFNIIIPLIKPCIAVVGILTFIWTYDNFLWALVVVSNTEMMTLPLILGRYAMTEGGVIAGASMATTSIVVIPVLIVYAFFQRFFIKGLSMTGIKG
jgi:multiple sugar transport system permease protein